MSKQVTTTNQTNVPAYLADQDLGGDVFEQNDVITPRLKICQPMSRIKENLQEIKDGSYYSTGVEKDLGKELEFFVLTKYNSKIWFNDKQNMVGYYSKNPRTNEEVSFGDEIESILSSKDRFEEGTDCFNYILVLADDLKDAVETGAIPTFYVYAASSAARKYAKKLNSILKANTQRKIPIWANRIMASSNMEKFDAGSAWMPEFVENGFASEAEAGILKDAYEAARLEQDKGAIHKEESSEDAKISEEDPFEND